MDLKRNSKAVWITIGVLYAIFIITLAVVRLYNPEMLLSRVFWWVIAGTLVFGGAAALVYYAGGKAVALAQQNKLPPAITFAQARAIAMQTLRDPIYMDEFDLNEPLREGVSDEGHPPSQVYRIVGPSKHVKGKIYAIGINMHFPEKRHLLSDPKSDYEVQRMIQKLAAFPRDEPQMKTISSLDPSTGRVVTQVEPVEEKQKEEESKKDELDK